MRLAAVGGFGRQYQVNVDPQKLRAYGIGIDKVVEVVRSGNAESGARLIELAGRVRDVGQVVPGPDYRRGAADLDGTGEAVSGIAMMRHGQNALGVIRRVKARLKEIEPGLPPGVKVQAVYDRSELIERSIDNFRQTISEVVLTAVLDARQALAGKVHLPPGYSLRWTGQYESMERVWERLRMVVPVTLFLVVVLLWLNTRSLAKSAIVLLAVPFSAIGAFWFLYALGYSISIAVWVGLIALLGVDAETGVFMLLYPDLAFERAAREGGLKTRADLHESIVAGAARGIPPKFMTVATTFIGPDSVGYRNRRGRDEAHRGADGGRRPDVVSARITGLSGHLRTVALARPAERQPGCPGPRGFSL